MRSSFVKHMTNGSLYSSIDSLSILLTINPMSVSYALSVSHTLHAPQCVNVFMSPHMRALVCVSFRCEGNKCRPVSHLFHRRMVIAAFLCFLHICKATQICLFTQHVSCTEVHDTEGLRVYYQNHRHQQQ